MTEEFLNNPSNCSKHLVNIVAQMDKNYRSKFNTKNIFKKNLNAYRLRMYIEDGYKDYYKFLNTYKVQVIPKKIKLLVEEFERLYDKLIFNNLALAYAYVIGKKISNPIITMEDKKIIYLQKLHNKEITLKQFNDRFGHYALNAYELSSKRFEEYSKKELLSLAKLTLNLKIKKKLELKDYAENDKIPVLISLRELARYKILFVVKYLRYELLRIGSEKGIKNIFDHDLSEFM